MNLLAILFTQHPLGRLLLPPARSFLFCFIDTSSPHPRSEHRKLPLYLQVHTAKPPGIFPADPHFGTFWEMLVINIQTHCGVPDRKATGTAVATHRKQVGLSVSWGIFSSLEVELLSTFSSKGDKVTKAKYREEFIQAPGLFCAEASSQGHK